MGADPLSVGAQPPDGQPPDGQPPDGQPFDGQPPDGQRLDWRPDVLGAGFEAATLRLRPEATATLRLRPEAAGPVTATLVRHRHSDRPSRRAVLYVHGYNDYFFQTGLAEWFDRRELDFYAVDLRRYGRSLGAGRPIGAGRGPDDRPIPNYIDDLGAYDEELDAALSVIRSAGHERVVLVAHSTGGLIVPLWLARRPAAPVDGMVLNSPFLEFRQPAVVRAALSATVSLAARARPERALPAGVDRGYGDSLHVSRHGEWDYNLDWKPSPGFPARIGWLRAVIDGHRAAHAGLDLQVPALVMSSTRTVSSKGSDDDLHRGDAVLDADSIARWAPALGRNVTIVRVDDGMHDLFLSARPARDLAYLMMGTWLSGWIR